METGVGARPLVTLPIGLVLTGGTVGSELTTDRVDHIVKLRNFDKPTDRTHASAELALLQASQPEGHHFDIRVRRPITILSEDIVPNDWITIARAARELVYEGALGILILHGTDTMSYTAAALSFLLRDLPVPIVLTGSNLPPNQSDSDAAKNTHDSLVALTALSPGIYITFAGSPNLPGIVHLGTCARKTRAAGHAFESVNRQPVGKVLGDTLMTVDPWTRPEPTSRTNRANRIAVDDRVLSFRLYPGIDFDKLRFSLQAGNIGGIVIELYASGTGPTTSGRFSLPSFVKDCTMEGIVVAAAVSAAPGSGKSNLYASTIELQENGALFLRETIPETATAKLMWALAQSDDYQTVADLMRTAIAGEIQIH